MSAFRGIGWVLLALIPVGTSVAEPWARHTIDDASQGADGVRLADLNADGALDVVTPWEEGGDIRVCFNPGPEKARRRWRSVSVGEVESPEDAVALDLDGDGALDVLSSCEGRTKSMWVHWGGDWRVEPLPASRMDMRWMFAVSVDVDGRHGVDIVAGSKDAHAAIGWFQAPVDARNLDGWLWYPMYDASWIMSLIPADVDGDGDTDVVATDRKGPKSGAIWLENPGAGTELTATWPLHPIGGRGQEVMFADLLDWDEDGAWDLVVAVKDGGILHFEATAACRSAWTVKTIPMPRGAGTGKAIRIADMDDDGRRDVLVSCEHSKGLMGVFWLSPPDTEAGEGWGVHDVSGPEGTKFDLVVPIDLDADGDLDVLTCEESEDLGVIWYENPARP